MPPAKHQTADRQIYRMAVGHTIVGHLAAKQQKMFFSGVDGNQDRAKMKSE